MVFVKRQNGAIVEIFNVAQAGDAEEGIDEANQEIVTFLKGRPGVPSYVSSLERTDLIPRAVRKFMLGYIEKEALLLGQNPMLLPAYVKVKNRDNQIKALRLL